MPTPASRAQDIAARLSASGFTPRITRNKKRIRIETDIWPPITEQQWRQLLSALALGDRFGLIGNAEQQTAWAHVHYEAPATAGHRPGARPPATGS